MTAGLTPTIHILGAGRTAGTLARAWIDNGVARVGLILNRSYASAAAAAEQIGAGRPVTSWETEFNRYMLDSNGSPQWILLGVPDGDMAAVVTRLTEWLQETPQMPTLAFHLSGQLSNEVLMPLQRHGMAVASVHPVLAFAQPETARRQLTDSHCMISANADIQPMLERLFSGIGMRCIAAPPTIDKAVYHAAMVSASNFTCALQYMAVNLARQAGLPEREALQLLTGLSRHSLSTIAEHGSLDALTGPVERGDIAATRRLLSAIESLPEVQSASLRSLSEIVLEMAKAKGSIDPEQAAELAELLESSERT